MSASDEMINAIRDNDHERVRELITSGQSKVSNIISREYGKYVAPLLTTALPNASVEMVRVLLDLGANPNAPDKHFQQTPLHSIAKLYQTHYDTLRYRDTPEAHANARAETKRLETIAEMLFVKGADPSLRDLYGKTPLDYIPQTTSPLAKLLTRVRPNAEGLRNLALVSVASAHGKANVPWIPHEVMSHVVAPFLKESGKPTKNLLPTYSSNKGGRKKMRKTRRRRTLRKHK